MKNRVIGYAVLALTIITTSAFLEACDGHHAQSTSSNPATAKGETPIRFIACFYGDTNCRVLARFDALSSCEVHKDFANTNCDFETIPDKIICTKDKERPSRTVFYCLP